MGRFLFTLLAVTLVSEEELRFAPVYKQVFDTSCGIAVTASLLNFYWNIPVTEGELYREMIADRLEEADTNYTISFLTIARYTQTRGIAAQGFRMDWNTLHDTLDKGYAPVIVHFSEPRAHFVLLLDIAGEYAIVADPALGMRWVRRAEFLEHYSGNALLAASGSAAKNTEYVRAVTGQEERRLESLRQLSVSRRFTAGSR